MMITISMTKDQQAVRLLHSALETLRDIIRKLLGLYLAQLQLKGYIMRALLMKL